MVRVNGNRETKSWVVLLSAKVTLSTLSLILILIFIGTACLTVGSGDVPPVVLLPAPQAA